MKLLLTVTTLLLLAHAGIGCNRAGGHAPAAQSSTAATAALEAVSNRPNRSIEARPLLEALRAELAIHRRLIVLFSDEGSLSGPAREAALHEGHRLHHEDRAMVFQLDQVLGALVAKPAFERDPALAAVLSWMEDGPEVMALDRLAFRDPLRLLQRKLLRDQSPAGVLLRTRVTADLAEVDRVEGLVDFEYRQVFGAPGLPPKGGDRVRWKDYVGQLRRLYPAPPPPVGPAPKLGDNREIDGRELPDKVLVLTFDDGPHRIYTEEIKAILQHYRVPAVFFEVGRSLGSLDASGQVRLGTLSGLTEDLVTSGFTVGNHSYTHAQLSRETGKPLDSEIGETDQILRAIPGAHSQLFRFPYGARSSVQLEALRGYHLRSVLWNIDSLDWADPVPSSVSDRVLRAIAQEKRGIILFHDIHDRAGKVLPGLIERLRAQGYRFGGLDANGDLVLPTP